MINLEDPEECKKLIALIINNHGTTLFVDNDEIYNAVAEEIKYNQDQQKTERWIEKQIKHDRW